MAGIGEANAILTVAQVGLQLSFALISYAGEAREVESRIRRIGDEISQTAGRLKDLGDLAQKKLLQNETAIADANRLATTCQSVILEIRTILKKSKVKLDEAAVDKEEIEITLFDRLQWPWVKTRLEVPRAELARLKADLTLMFLSLMALGASSEAEKHRFIQPIPGLEKTLQWASARYQEAVKRRAHRADIASSRTSYTASVRSIAQSPNSSRGHQNARQRGYTEDELNMRHEFFEFKRKQIADMQERRHQAEMALRKVEEERAKAQEDEKRKEIQEQAIEEWKAKVAKEEEEKKKRDEGHRKIKETLQRELENIGLEAEQIRNAIESLAFQQIPQLNLQCDKITLNDRDVSGVNAQRGSDLNGKGESALTWFRNRFRNSLLKSHSSGSSFQSALDDILGINASDGPYAFEAWSIDQALEHRFQIPFSESWLATCLLNYEKRGKSMTIWKEYSNLHTWYKTQVHCLCQEKAKSITNFQWSLASIEKIKKKTGFGSWIRPDEHYSLQVILRRSRATLTFREPALESARVCSEDAKVPSVSDKDMDASPKPTQRQDDGKDILSTDSKIPLHKKVGGDDGTGPSVTSDVALKDNKQDRREEDQLETICLNLEQDLLRRERDLIDKEKDLNRRRRNLMLSRRSGAEILAERQISPVRGLSFEDNDLPDYSLDDSESNDEDPDDDPRREAEFDPRLSARLLTHKKRSRSRGRARSAEDRSRSPLSFRRSNRQPREISRDGHSDERRDYSNERFRLNLLNDNPYFTSRRPRSSRASSERSHRDRDWGIVPQSFEIPPGAVEYIVPERLSPPRVSSPSLHDGDDMDTFSLNRSDTGKKVTFSRGVKATPRTDEEIVNRYLHRYASNDERARNTNGRAIKIPTTTDASNPSPALSDFDAHRHANGNSGSASGSNPFSEGQIQENPRSLSGEGPEKSVVPPLDRVQEYFY